jgi:hypothetical protein
MTAKVIDIWKWRRPRKLGEPYCAIPMRVKLRSGWGYWDLRGGCFRRLTEDVTMLVDWIGENEQELYGRLDDGRRICIDSRAVIGPA